MLEIKKNKTPVIPITITAIFIFIWIIFKVYGFFVEASAKNTINDIKSNYSSRIESVEKTNINDLISKKDQNFLNIYNRHIQPISSKYELLDSWKHFYPVKNSDFPYDYSMLNLADSDIGIKDLDLQNSLDLTGTKLNFTARLYKILNPSYESTGTWAVYLNNTLQYSSAFILNNNNSESIGSHSFYYKFAQSKRIYFRAVYKFINKNTEKTEYFVIEKPVTVKIERAHLKKPSQFSGSNSP